MYKLCGLQGNTSVTRSTRPPQWSLFLKTKFWTKTSSKKSQNQLFTGYTRARTTKTSFQNLLVVRKRSSSWCTKMKKCRRFSLKTLSQSLLRWMKRENWLVDRQSLPVCKRIIHLSVLTRISNSLHLWFEGGFSQVCTTGRFLTLRHWAHRAEISFFTRLDQITSNEIYSRSRLYRWKMRFW